MKKYTNNAWTSSTPHIFRQSYNLFDKTNTSTADGYMENTYLLETGTQAGASYDVSIYIPVSASTTYTLSFSDSLTVYAPSVHIYDTNKEFLSGIKYDGRHAVPIVVPANGAYIRISIQKTYVDSYMLNEGSTALPYEPYDTTLKWYAAADHKRTSGAWS